MFLLMVHLAFEIFKKIFTHIILHDNISCLKSDGFIDLKRFSRIVKRFS